MKVPRDYRRFIEEVFEEFGVTDWHIDRTRKHPMIVFTLAGERVKYFIPSTPSDPRSMLNCRADLRRMCRLQRPDRRGILQM